MLDFTSPKPLECAEGTNSALAGTCSLQHPENSRCHQCGTWQVTAFGNLTLDSSRKKCTSPLTEGCSLMVLVRLERVVFWRGWVVSSQNWQ